MLIKKVGPKKHIFIYISIYKTLNYILYTTLYMWPQNRIAMVLAKTLKYTTHVTTKWGKTALQNEIL